MAFIAFNSLFDLQFTFWTTLISIENRLPFSWPTVATNVLNLLLSLGFVNFTTVGLGGAAVFRRELGRQKKHTGTVLLYLWSDSRRGAVLNPFPRSTRAVPR